MMRPVDFLSLEDEDRGQRGRSSAAACRWSAGRRVWEGRCCTWWMTPGISGYEQAGELIADQHEPGAHHGDVGGIGVLEEAGGTTPEAHRDQDCAEREQLADLHPDVERQQVGQ